MSLQRLGAGEALNPDTQGGAELLVLEGALLDGREILERGAWLRLPPGSASALRAGPEGVTLYLKTGHLSALTGMAP